MTSQAIFLACALALMPLCAPGSAVAAGQSDDDDSSTTSSRPQEIPSSEELTSTTFSAEENRRATAGAETHRSRNPFANEPAESEENDAGAPTRYTHTDSGSTHPDFDR